MRMQHTFGAFSNIAGTEFLQAPVRSNSEKAAQPYNCRLRNAAVFCDCCSALEGNHVRLLKHPPGHLFHLVWEEDSSLSDELFQFLKSLRTLISQRTHG